MEEFHSEIHFISEVLKNESIRETTNNIINKYQLQNYIYENEEEIIDALSNINIIEEDIWKENTSLEQKHILEEELLFSIYLKLYDSFSNNNRFKKY